MTKGPRLISFLALIILTIILLSLEGTMKTITIFTILIADCLLFASVLKEKEKNATTWFTLGIGVIVLLFSALRLKSGINPVTDALSIGIIFAIIIGFFLNIRPNKCDFEKELEEKSKEETPKIKIVEIDDQEVKVETNKTAIKKETKKNNKTTKEFIVSSPTSKKYHLPNCRFMKNVSKDKITVFTSKQQAGRKGLKKCNACLK